MTTEIQHYNDKAVFGDIILPLEQMFEALTDERRDIYYEHLRGKDRALLKQAVAYLINNHTYKRFPLLDEIRKAIAGAYRGKLRDGAGKLRDLKSDCDCRMCNCTGFVLFEKKHQNTDQTYTTARHCVCSVGQWLRVSTSKEWGRHLASEPPPQPIEPVNDFV